jgi:hypothetical protein
VRRQAASRRHRVSRPLPRRPRQAGFTKPYFIMSRKFVIRKSGELPPSRGTASTPPSRGRREFPFLHDIRCTGPRPRRGVRGRRRRLGNPSGPAPPSAGRGRNSPRSPGRRPAGGRRRNPRLWPDAGLPGPPRGIARTRPSRWSRGRRGGRRCPFGHSGEGAARRL